MRQRDFYQLLGVERTASSAEVRSAYARLARIHHPDQAGALPERLRDVQEAYRCLSDPKKRAAHDRMKTEADQAHRRRQQRVQQRLRRYDRHHPHRSSRLGRRWRAALLIAAALLGVGLWLSLAG